MGNKSIKGQELEGNQKHYGPLTAITMIVGIVIGSGIFFKCDDVLLYTGGNIWLGTAVFCIGALSIIFGSLTLTEISIRTNKNGGLVAYYEEFISKKAACGFGWFQTLVYYPTINVVVSWVAGIYTCGLFGIESTLENQILIGVAYLILIYAVNIISLKTGGYFQNLSTVIKLIPLLGIAVASIFWSAPNPELPLGVEMVSKSDVGIHWLAALVPIAFSYDGWVIATSITNEVKNPKRNMPLALIIGPLIILGVYVLYFLGFTKILGAEYIMSLGDDALNVAGELILGAGGRRVLLVIIIIAVLGVVNGITLGSLRMPQALASKGMFPFAKKIEKISPGIGLSPYSCIISFVTSIIWMVLHYMTQKSGVMKGRDISEISIVFSYSCYIILYIKVMKMKIQGEVAGIFKGIICPMLGIAGALIILLGGILSNPEYVIKLIAFSFFVCIIGYTYYLKKIS